MNKTDSNTGNNHIKKLYNMDESKDVCGVCLDVCKLPYTLECNHTFCYMCIKYSLSACNECCPLCRAIIPEEIMNKAIFTEESTSDVIRNIVWQYQSKRPGQWWYYSQELNDELENDWKSGNDVSELTIFGKIYEIDFGTMIQMSPDGNIRKIRRLDGAYLTGAKGISGLIFKDMVE